MDVFERIPLITKRLYDFTLLSASSAMDVIAIKRLDLIMRRQLTIEMRVHSKNIATGTITARVVPVSFTIENPAVDFVDSVTTPVDLTVGSAGSTPDLLATDVGFAGAVDSVRLIIRGLQGSSGALSATLSVDALVKSRL